MGKTSAVDRRPWLLSITASAIVVIVIFVSFNIGIMPRHPGFTLWILSAALIVIASALLELREWARVAALSVMPAYGVAALLVFTRAPGIVVPLAVLAWAWAFLCFSQITRKVLALTQDQKNAIIPRRKWLGLLYLAAGLLWAAPPFLILFSRGWKDAVEQYYLPTACLLILAAVCGVRLNLNRPPAESSRHFA
jgi:hypothetical protein